MDGSIWTNLRESLQLPFYINETTEPRRTEIDIIQNSHQTYENLSVLCTVIVTTILFFVFLMLSFQKKKRRTPGCMTIEQMKAQRPADSKKTVPRHFAMDERNMTEENDNESSTSKSDQIDKDPPKSDFVTPHEQIGLPDQPEAKNTYVPLPVNPNLQTEIFRNVDQLLSLTKVERKNSRTAILRPFNISEVDILFTSPPHDIKDHDINIMESKKQSSICDLGTQTAPSFLDYAEDQEQFLSACKTEKCRRKRSLCGRETFDDKLHSSFLFMDTSSVPRKCISAPAIHTHPFHRNPHSYIPLTPVYSTDVESRSPPNDNVDSSVLQCLTFGFDVMDKIHAPTVVSGHSSICSFGDDWQNTSPPQKCEKNILTSAGHLETRNTSNTSVWSTIASEHGLDMEQNTIPRSTADISKFPKSRSGLCFPTSNVDAPTDEFRNLKPTPNCESAINPLQTEYPISKHTAELMSNKQNACSANMLESDRFPSEFFFHPEGVAAFNLSSEESMSQIVSEVTTIKSFWTVRHSTTE